MAERIGSAMPMKDPTTYLNYDDCIALEEASSGRNRIMISLMWRCGLRVNELITIRKRDIYIDSVDLENSVIVVLGKGNKPRRVPIDTYLIEPLEGYIENFGEDSFIFPSHSISGHISKQWVRRILVKTGKRIGILQDVGGHPIHPHTLRHTFAIFLVTMGVPISKVQQILGHSSLSSTTYYLQFSKEELAKDYHEAFRKIRLKNTG